jgi:hypothetical protein
MPHTPFYFWVVFMAATLPHFLRVDFSQNRNVGYKILNGRYAQSSGGDSDCNGRNREKFDFSQFAGEA